MDGSLANFEKTGIKQRFISSESETAESGYLSFFQLSESEINGVDTIVSVTNTPSKFFQISQILYSQILRLKRMYIADKCWMYKYIDALRIIYSLFESIKVKRL